MAEEPKGRAIGAHARARSKTAEERQAQAKKAAEARWGTDGVPTAEYIGTLKLGDLEIPCAVLPDGRRVLSQRGIMAALGRTYGGKTWKALELGEDAAGKLPPFLAVSSLKPFVDNELGALVSAPIPYKHGQGGGVAHGVDAALLPRICDVWLKAREAGALTTIQKAQAQRAEVLVRGLAHVGIISLVDEATGFQKDRARDALAQILEAFVARELQPYLKTFPADYYEQLSRLYGLPYPPIGNKSFRPAFFGTITNNVVYSRLAPELLPELKKAASKAEKKAKLHQWLTQDIGHPKLREHLASIVSILKLSRTPEEFKANVNLVHPPYGETKPLDFGKPD